MPVVHAYTSVQYVFDPASSYPVLHATQCPSDVRAATLAHVLHPAPALTSEHVNSSAHEVPLTT